MAEKNKCYENYPLRIVLFSNIVSIAIYAIGAFIIYQLGLIWLLAFLLYILWLEIKILKNSCPNCYYYGKLCAFGKGKLSPILFKKGNQKGFTERKIEWKEILPDFLASIIPLLVGIGLLVIKFDFLIMGLLVLLVLLTSVGNSYVRGSLACKYCKQREIGCPAEKLFSKNKK